MQSLSVTTFVAWKCNVFGWSNETKLKLWSLQVKGQNPVQNSVSPRCTDNEDKAESPLRSSTPDVGLHFSSPVELQHDLSPVRHFSADTELLPAIHYQVPAMPSNLSTIPYHFEVPAVLLDPNENEVFVLQGELSGQEISDDTAETLPIIGVSPEVFCY